MILINRGNSSKIANNNNNSTTYYIIFFHHHSYYLIILLYMMVVLLGLSAHILRHRVVSCKKVVSTTIFSTYFLTQGQYIYKFAPYYRTLYAWRRLPMATIMDIDSVNNGLPVLTRQLTGVLDNSLDDALYNAGDDFCVQNGTPTPIHSHGSPVVTTTSLKASDAKESLNFRWGGIKDPGVAGKENQDDYLV